MSNNIRAVGWFPHTDYKGTQQYNVEFSGEIFVPPAMVQAIQADLQAKILAAVEGLQRMSPVIKQVDLVTRQIGARYSDDDKGELLIRAEVLSAIREVTG